MAERPREDLERGLELLRDDLARAELEERFHLREEARPHDDVERGMERARQRGHAADRRGVRDRDHEHAGLADPRVLEDLRVDASP